MKNIKENLQHYLGKKRNRRAVATLAALLVILYYPVKEPLIRNDYSLVVADENNEIMRVFLTSDQQYCLPPKFNDTVPGKLEAAVIYFEDKHYYLHPGVNPVSIVRAVIHNLRYKKIVSGASTITMQLARIRKGRKRTTINKLVEMVEAVRLEAQYSKSELLKLYLDHAPYGGNIIGYQAASWRYFGKPPMKLSWAEACLLAVLPNSPGSMSPIKNRDKLLKKRNRLLTDLCEQGAIDSTELNNSINEPMPSRIISFDLRAPHLTRKIHAEKSENTRIVKTTISPVIQDRTNDLVKKYYRQLNRYGIKNASVIVVHNKSRQIKAYIGSQDFNGEAGRVDGVMAMRSSGSILKPFLYALAMQQGLIIPESLLQDIPTYYGTFSPHNASEKYSGIVTAQEALVRSLNVPAVRMLYTYGHYNFYNFLKEAGITTLHRSADGYGLPLILGGAEVTLYEMASIYCNLANLGDFSPITYLRDRQIGYGDSRQLIDTASVVLTLNILKELRRPGSEYYWNKFNSQRPIAWKTGTSYGHKDAWAIGVNPEWTVAVWVGNFDATINKNLSGASSAGPLLFDIINYLPQKSNYRWWNKSQYISQTSEICAVSGYIATNNCKQKLVSNLVRQDILKNCSYHLKVFIDTITNHSVCSKCWSKGYKESTYLSYSPLVTNYLRKNGAIIEKIPTHNPNCQVHKSNTVIEIEYPKPDSKIIIARDFDGKYQPVIFSAVHQLPEASLYWYLDNNYLGETKTKHKINVALTGGNHVLSLIDNYGNSKELSFYSTIQH